MNSGTQLVALCHGSPRNQVNGADDNGYANAKASADLHSQGFEADEEKPKASGRDQAWWWLYHGHLGHLEQMAWPLWLPFSHL